ncbi:MAG: hypothetical protein J6B07_02290 [Opitutales bacterium]|nr:hypothetical protein [Opitutales bacterium]
MKKIISAFLLHIVVVSFVCGAHITEVKLLKDEKWWGGATAWGHEMPLSNKTRIYDLGRNHGSNQASPLLVSSKGRYVWSEKPFRFSMNNGVLILSSDFEKIEPKKAGSTMKEAYLEASQRHFKSDGKIPPEIFFTKPQFNTWIELVREQRQKDILKYANDIKKYGFPCGVLMIDGNWDRYYGMLDFDGNKIPDPKGLNKALHEMGYKIIYWIGPFVGPAGAEFLELEKAGLLLMDKDKDKKRAVVIPWWSGFSASFDTTNQKSLDYLEARLRKMQKEYDIDGFKFDGGDIHHVRGKNVAFHKDSNIMADYTQGWAELGYRFKYNELRASWKMGGKALVQRLLDKLYSWNDVKLIVPHMLNAGIIGYAYTCPDMIGGGDFVSFKNVDYSKLDQRLIVRYAQASALMPMMQFSLAPWRVLDKKHLRICRDAAILHTKFADYILELARHSSKTGEPIVRAMAYEFPNENLENIIDQFMLGDRYLVAPVVTPDDSRRVVLPKGKWQDELGNVYEGGRTIKIDVPIERLPYFKKM